MSMTKEYGPSVAYAHGAFEPITFVVTSTEQASGSYYKFKYIADITLRILLHLTPMFYKHVLR